MTQQVRFRRHATVSYTANAKVSEELSRGMVIRELYLHYTGQLTLTAANNTAANTLKGDEWAAITRIDIIANNVDVIFSMSGNQLWWLNYFLYGRGPKVEPTMGDASTLNMSFDTTAILPFWMPRAIRPMDTALDTRILSSLKIEVTWGTEDSINASATGWTTEPSLEVRANESFNIEGTFSQWRRFAIEKEITASNTQFQLKLPVGNLYRAFLINFDDAGVDDGTILNNFKLRSGTTIFADIDDNVLQDAAVITRGLQRGYSGSAYDDLRAGNGNALEGWYYYDHVQDGFNSEAIDTLGLSEFELELDVNVGGGTTKVIVLPQMIVPVRAQNAG